MNEFQIFFETTLYPIILIALFLCVYVYCAKINTKKILGREGTGKEIAANMAINYLAMHVITSLFNRKTK